MNKDISENSYQCKVNINAPLSRVYQAITKDIEKWWTEDCEIEPVKMESKFTVRFGETYSIIQNKELIPHNQIVWECIQQHHANQVLTKTDEWENTKIIFHLKDDLKGGTTLNFIHDGLTPKLECFEICQNGWDHFLKTSLKSYLETGNGYPYKHRETEAKK